MSSLLVPNKTVPSAPRPLANLGALVQVVTALQQGVQSLGGQTGNPLNRAVTFNDLIDLGLVTATDLAQSSDVLAPYAQVAPIALSGFVGGYVIGTVYTVVSESFEAPCAGSVIALAFFGPDAVGGGGTVDVGVTVNGASVASDGEAGIPWFLAGIASVAAGPVTVACTVKAASGSPPTVYVRGVAFFLPSA